MDTSKLQKKLRNQSSIADRKRRPSRVPSQGESSKQLLPKSSELKSDRKRMPIPNKPVEMVIKPKVIKYEEEKKPTARPIGPDKKRPSRPAEDENLLMTGLRPYQNDPRSSKQKRSGPQPLPLPPSESSLKSDVTPRSYNAPIRSSSRVKALAEQLDSRQKQRNLQIRGNPKAIEAEPSPNALKTLNEDMKPKVQGVQKSVQLNANPSKTDRIDRRKNLPKPKAVGAKNESAGTSLPQKGEEKHRKTDRPSFSTRMKPKPNAKLMQNQKEIDQGPGPSEPLSDTESNSEEEDQTSATEGKMSNQKQPAKSTWAPLKSQPTISIADRARTSDSIDSKDSSSSSAKEPLDEPNYEGDDEMTWEREEQRRKKWSGLKTRIPPKSTVTQMKTNGETKDIPILSEFSGSNQPRKEVKSNSEEQNCTDEGTTSDPKVIGDKKVEQMNRNRPRYNVRTTVKSHPQPSSQKPTRQDEYVIGQSGSSASGERVTKKDKPREIKSESHQKRKAKVQIDDVTDLNNEGAVRTSDSNYLADVSSTSAEPHGKHHRVTRRNQTGVNPRETTYTGEEYRLDHACVLGAGREGTPPEGAGFQYISAEYMRDARGSKLAKNPWVLTITHKSSGRRH